MHLKNLGYRMKPFGTIFCLDLLTTKFDIAKVGMLETFCYRLRAEGLSQ